MGSSQTKVGADNTRAFRPKKCRVNNALVVTQNAPSTPKTTKPTAELLPQIPTMKIFFLVSLYFERKCSHSLLSM
jgi:hypothetical protein